MLFDTHLHLEDKQFDNIREEVLQEAKDANVTRMLAVGITLETSLASLNLAKKHAGVYAAVGIHPNSCHEASEKDWEKITSLTNDPKVIAIGETGLDKYWDFAPIELQEEYFRKHIHLSQKTGLPFIVHMRDCSEEILTILKEGAQEGPLFGIMHSYTGNQELLGECLDLGLHISFSGILTFKKSTAIREVAAKVPDNRILIETDAPYLSPEPVRGKRPNRPAYVSHTANCLAQVRGVSPEQIAFQTTQNGCDLFGIT
ncbi:MAG: TatD family hydrolase [Pirellulaceae bacterium]|nr:TatD family hydrolase [Pirellulaceae bacterium]